MSVTSSARNPLDAVLVAFGVTDIPVPLPGGKGGTWRAGRLVLNPVECPAETLWRAEVLDGLPDSAGFRVARPARTVSGAWTAQGWEASHLVEGEPDARRPDDVLRAAIAFHAVIAGLPRPAFLDRRDDPWSRGDRVAWDELPARTCPAALELLERSSVPAARSPSPRRWSTATCWAMCCSQRPAAGNHRLARILAARFVGIRGRGH